MINPTRLLICWQYFARFLIIQANKLAITWNININIYLFILTSQSSNKVPYYMKFSRQLNFWGAYCFVTLKILEFFLTFLETNKEISLFSTSNFGVFKKTSRKTRYLYKGVCKHNCLLKHVELLAGEKTSRRWMVLHLSV